MSKGVEKAIRELVLDRRGNPFFCISSRLLESGRFAALLGTDGINGKFDCHRLGLCKKRLPLYFRQILQLFRI